MNMVADDQQPPTWNLTINNTQPVFFYCTAPGSCINYQMVGVINPNSSVSLATQRKDASLSTYMLAPGQPFPSEDGGVPQGDINPPGSSSSSSSSSSVSTSTTPTPSAPAPASASSTAASHTSSGGVRLSAGAIAGIVIAAVFVVLLLVALFFLLGRHKSLLQMARVHGGNHHENAPLTPGGHASMQTGMVSSPYQHPHQTAAFAAGPLPSNVSAVPPRSPYQQPHSTHAYPNSYFPASDPSNTAPPYSERGISPPLRDPSPMPISELSGVGGLPFAPGVGGGKFSEMGVGGHPASRETPLPDMNEKGGAVVTTPMATTRAVDGHNLEPETRTEVSPVLRPQPQREGIRPLSWLMGGRRRLVMRHLPFLLPFPFEKIFGQLSP